MTNKAISKEFLSSQKFLNHLIDIINDAIILTDVEHNILFINKTSEYLLGFGESELIGKNINTLFLEDDHDCLVPNIFSITKEKGSFKGELLLRKNSGETLAIYLSTYFYGGKNKDGDGIVLFVINDITTIKNLEYNYSESEKLAFIGRLTKGIVHEVRNPLVSMIGFARRLCVEMDPANPNLKYLDIINNESHRLEKLLKYIEEFANLPKPVFKRESIEEIVKSVINQFRDEAKKSEVNIHFKKNCTEGDEYIFIDRSLLVNALMHILENAFDAISFNGEVTFVVLDSNEYIGIEVTDNGCGIPEHYLNTIFEPFFSTKSGHIGLSLTTVKRVIEVMGGYIEVKSNMGHATTFNIMLLKDRRSKLRTVKVFENNSGLL